MTDKIKFSPFWLRVLMEENRLMEAAAAGVIAEGTRFSEAEGAGVIAEGTPHGGIKHDAGKTRYDLLPADSLDAIAEVFTYGAGKYTPRNWEKGIAWGRLFAALMRHLWAFWRHEPYDLETGLPHLAHAGACIMMLLSHYLREIGEDDRA